MPGTVQATEHIGDRRARGRALPRPLCLSVVVPVYNERDTVQETLRRVRALDVDLQLIVVDDGSTDGSRELLEAEADLLLLEHSVNQGKGMAIRTALEHVTGDVVAIQDADLECDPRDLIRLIEPIARGEARVVYGSRFLNGRPSMPWVNYVYNRLITCVANLLYRADITDEATCYKVFDAEIIRSMPLSCRRFEFCAEVTAGVRKLGERIVELPISYTPRSYRQGKKIRWWDGLVTLWTLVKLRFRT